MDLRDEALGTKLFREINGVVFSFFLFLLQNILYIAYN